MKNTEILIVEDDMIIASDISIHLSRLGYEVTGIVARGEDAIAQVTNHQPDIVLMDVNLKGHIDGVETTRQIQQIYPDIIIIYLTANVDDATYNAAKTTRPQAFIAKPFKKRDLERTIDLALISKEGRPANNTSNPEPHPAEDQGPGPDSFILTDRIFVKYKDKMIKIFIKDILFAEADRNYCKVYTSEKDHLLSLPLKAFEEKLSAKNFIRIHRSYIINLTKVDALSDNCSHVTLKDHSLPVSKSYKEDLINSLKMI